ncbi:MAG TPA: hypothetical protein VK776_14065 [Bryobacteraceae bacterium]|nr:hypothetical protein [Bryobacteraceae bacterium]
MVSTWAAKAQPVSLDWRHIGNSAIELSMPSVATGPVSRVWYSEDGSVLYAQTGSGRIFATTDFEQWKQVQGQSITPPAPVSPESVTVPEAGLKIRSQQGGSSRFYGAGHHAYRSDDGGITWANLTAYKGGSILGDGLADLAVSPREPDEVVVAARTGVWRTMDGGLTWTGLNQFLPNLPTGHLLGVPNGPRGVRLALKGGAAEIEWAPGEKTAWRPVDSADLVRENNTKAALSQILNHSITAVTTAKDYIYSGDSEGRLQVSPDAGVSWPQQFKLADLGAVESIWVDANDPRVAVAVLTARPAGTQSQSKPTYVLRTMNGGMFWDDITANLPDTAAAHGVAADRASGAVYVATDAGVFFTITDLASAGSATSWASLSEKLPAGATDVRLDGGANQLYAAVDGYGVYAAIAPHRFRDASVVNAADYSSRATAPGALLSVLGTRVESASSGNTVVPVLDATNTASQIQVPFEAQGNTFSLSLEAAAGRMTVGLPLQSVSPAIFVDPEGTPLILDADSGVLLDSTKPAHSNSRIQILTTGLGLVRPDWPTGLVAPQTDPPRVVAPVHAYLDHSPVVVTQASLAPGYIGFYLIEIQLPQIVNAGPGELYVEAEGQQSNRVRIYTQP